LKIWRVFAFAALHFGLTLLTAVLAHGTSLQEDVSRSGFASAASVVYKALMLPLTAARAAAPAAWQDGLAAVGGMLMIVHSLVWGVVLALLFAAWRGRRAGAAAG